MNHVTHRSIRPTALKLGFALASLTALALLPVAVQAQAPPISPPDNSQALRVANAGAQDPLMALGVPSGAPASAAKPVESAAPQPAVVVSGPAPTPLTVPPPVVAPPVNVPSASVPAVAASESSTEDLYVVPGTDTLQKAAAINGIIALETSEAKLEELRQKRETQRVKFAADLAKAKMEKDTIETGGVSKTRKSAVEDEPVYSVSVASIYRLNDRAYAEIMLGATKVVAQTGTQLINGDKVVAISDGSVTVKGKSGTKTLPVLGSASTNIMLPVSSPNTAPATFPAPAPVAVQAPVMMPANPSQNN